MYIMNQSTEIQTVTNELQNALYLLTYSIRLRLRGIVQYIIVFGRVHLISVVTSRHAGTIDAYSSVAFVRIKINPDPV